MVIYTPRLCNDATFHPPRDNKANSITCREVLSLEQQEGFAKHRAEQEQADTLKILENAQKALDAQKIVKEKKLEEIVFVYPDGL